MQRQFPEEERLGFEIPQLPPWKTPQMKQHTQQAQQTPLRRPRCILGAPYEPSRASSVGASQKRDYDYSVFNESRLLTESKIDQYLKSEAATHKRVFHRDRPHDDSYRPDLQPLCCDSSDEEGEPRRAQSARGERPLVLSIPGIHPEEMYDTRRRPTDLHSDFEDESQLRRYWNWSQLSKTLGPREQHLLNRILQKEIQLQQHFRDIISRGDGYRRAEGRSDDDAYLELKHFTHICYEEDNCVFNMDDLIVYMKGQQ
ncbi:AaceriAGR070Cp [[Ashbya] aceris (nom. inval.)]|nr:AaceriAGR070Cp [[Ashbya] aceris (nom. inval.)]